MHCEQHYRPKDLARLWGFSVDTVRSWFENEPGILIESRPETMHKRKYTSMRIPESVATRVYAKHLSR
jgi:hypothetical protein